VEREVEASLEAARLRRAIEQLTTDQQQVVLLRFNAGLKLKEAAYVMDRSIDAVKMLQSRALTSLRQLVDQAGMDGMVDAGR
jgi:RNA polymerase sigma-70 factor (ECF subfamily)